MFLRRKPTSVRTDEELVTILRDGHRSALGELWDRYAQLLFGVCMKYLKDTERSKDLVTELFTDLPAMLDKHTVERFRPWVHTVMRNRCLLVLRGERRNDHVDEQAVADHAEADDEALLRERSLVQLEQAIEQLNPDQRTDGATCVSSSSTMASRTTFDPFASPEAPTAAQLIAYVEGKLSPAEQHRVELAMEADPLVRDAVEGLHMPGALQAATDLERARPAGGASSRWARWAGGGLVLVATVAVLLSQVDNKHSAEAPSSDLATTTKSPTEVPVVDMVDQPLEEAEIASHRTAINTADRSYRRTAGTHRGLCSTRCTDRPIGGTRHTHHPNRTNA